MSEQNAGTSSRDAHSRPRAGPSDGSCSSATQGPGNASGHFTPGRSRGVGLKGLWTTERHRPTFRAVQFLAPGPGQPIFAVPEDDTFVVVTVHFTGQPVS